MTDQKASLAVVLPALNEEGSINTTIRSIKSSLQRIGADVKTEIVVVDGNSTDGTVSVAREAGARIITQKARGYGDALYCGFLFAKEELAADLIATLDADGTYDPTSLADMIEAIVGGNYDLLVGKRIPVPGAMKLANRLGNRAVSLLVRSILGTKLTDTQSGMLVFRSTLVNNIRPKTRGWAFNTEVLTRALECGFRIGEHPVTYNERKGETKLSLVRGGIANIVVIVRMTRDARPLFFYGTLGLLFLLSALFLGIETLLRYSQLLAVLTAITALTGIQVFVFGLLADAIKDLRVASIRRVKPYTEQ